jgi:hypothetical protein
MWVLGMSGVGLCGIMGRFWRFGQGLGDFRLIRGRSREDFGLSKRGLCGF